MLTLIIYERGNNTAIKTVACSNSSCSRCRETDFSYRDWEEDRLICREKKKEFSPQGKEGNVEVYRQHPGSKEHENPLFEFFQCLETT